VQPLQVTHGETWTVFRRGPRDRTGDSAFVENGEIEDCVFDEQPPEEITGGREAAAYGGNLYVPKAADVLATDKLRGPDGIMYRVIGGPKWNKVHPMTGWDSGYKMLRLEGVS
jgi:hypothetical protein